MEKSTVANCDLHHASYHHATYGHLSSDIKEIGLNWASARVRCLTGALHADCHFNFPFPASQVYGRNLMEQRFVRLLKWPYQCAGVHKCTSLLLE